jgi:hypothetical protein
MSERKLARRSVAIAFGMICVFLVAGAVGAVAVYNSMVNDRNSALASKDLQLRSLNSQLSSLESQISSLRAQIADLQAHALVVVEGRIYGPRVYIPEGAPPWGYELDSNGTTIGISWDGCDFFNWTSVKVYGVVTQGTLGGGLTEPPGSVYYVKAVRIDLL